jgi:hypothetical protein
MEGLAMFNMILLKGGRQKVMIMVTSIQCRHYVVYGTHQFLRTCGTDHLLLEFTFIQS